MVKKGDIMQAVGELVTSRKFMKTTSNELTSLEVKERALEIARGLTSTIAPNDMTAWYCKAYKLLGESRYTAVVAAAREADCDPSKGQSQKKIFGWLLKKEMSRRQQNALG